MKVSAELLSSLIAEVYAAAAEPALWPLFLRSLETVTESRRSYMMCITEKLHTSFAVANGLDSHLAGLYAEHYAHRDDVVFAYEAARNSAGGTWVGNTRSVIPDAVFQRSDIFNDIAVPQGDTQMCGALIGQREGAISVVLRRAKGQPQFDSYPVDLIAVLVPHIQHAIALQGRLAELAERAAVFEGSADAFGVAVLSLDSNGFVHSTSRRAEALLCGKWLRIKGRRLCAASVESDVRLQALIASAVKHRGSRPIVAGLTRRSAPESSRFAASTLAAGGSMLIRREPFQKLVAVHVYPMQAETAGFDPARLAAVVFLGDGTICKAGWSEVLRELFGATPTEVRFAQIFFAGNNVKEAAAALGLSPDAIRFHLKRLYIKTGTTGQANLMKLLASLPGSFDTP